MAAVARTANEQRSRTHRVCFLDGRGPVGDALVDEGLAVRFRMNAGGSPIGLQRFGRYLRSTRPSILHLHTAAIGTHLAALTALPRTPMVYTEHFPRVLDRAARYRAIYRLHRRRGTRFVALSDGMARAMVSCGLDEARITVVPNAVCVPILDASANRADDGDHRLRRPARRSAAHGACSSTSCPSWRREGRPARRSSSATARRARVSSVMRPSGESASGFASSGSRTTSSRGSTASTSSSSTREAAVYPLALLEAMARGVPVVAMRARGGLAEIAEEGGLHLPDREISTAADALRAPPLLFRGALPASPARPRARPAALARRGSLSPRRALRGL